MAGTKTTKAHVLIQACELTDNHCEKCRWANKCPVWNGWGPECIMVYADDLSGPTQLSEPLPGELTDDELDELFEMSLYEDDWDDFD